MSGRPESKAKEADKETPLGEFVDIGQKTFKGKDDAIFDVIETMVRKKVEVCETFHACLACKPTFGPWTAWRR
jgi:hypothetical protein